LDGGVVGEGGFAGGRLVAEDLEGVFVEVEERFAVAGVVDEDRVGGCAVVAWGKVWGEVGEVVWGRAVFRRGVEVELGANVAAGRLVSGG
jgi:hypothetical protein